MAGNFESKKPSKKKVNKKLLLQALTEPKFRKLLETDPEKALGVSKLSDKHKHEIELLLANIKGIDCQISSLADKLLCADPPPCGIAVG